MLEIFNPIFLIFTSYAIGVLGTIVVKYFGLYSWFQNHNYISDNLTKKFGVLKLGWLIRKTFLGKFNQNLKLSGKIDIQKLEKLKAEMALAENGHLIAFILLQLYVFLLAYFGIPTWQIIGYTLTNIVFNLYLVFLQQYNKRRIDKLLKLKNKI